MKRALLRWLAVAVTALCGHGALADFRRKAPRPRALDVAAFLSAIRQVESGDNPHALGRCGERSAYQFMPATWAQYTNAPLISWASDRAIADKVARAHLGWLCGQLSKRGHLLEPTLLAAAWHHGHAQAVQHLRGDYARRVANLYRDFLQ